MKAWTIAALGVAALAWPGLAQAAGQAVWWVEASGSCGAERASLEREVMLACAAVGDTCRVAARKTDAELVAVIACAIDDAPWTLETRTSEGALLGVTELAGAREDRMREAAMEVARDAAPERVLAIDSLRYTLSDADHAPQPPEHASRFALGAAGRGSVHTDVAASGGGSFLAGLRAFGPAHVLARFSMEGGGSGFDAYRDIRVGAGLGVGAPVDPTHVLGVALVGGVDARQSYIPFYGSSSLPSGKIPTQTDPAAFLDAAIFIQLPTGDVRPFVAFGASVASQQSDITTTAELGLTVGLF